MLLNKKQPFIVKESGRTEADIVSWDEERKILSVELTEEEKTSKYAKYYYRGITLPSDENLKQCEICNPLPLEECFMPEDYVKRMTPETMDQMRTGYRVMDNGIGYSVARVFMPGVTDEVMEVFNENYNPEGDLFYKSWYPGFHMRHYEMMAVEDVGFGMEIVKFLDFIPPSRFGITPDAPMANEDFAFMNGLNGISYPYHTPYRNERYVLETCFWRNVAGGREIFVHFWHGLSWDLENMKSIRRIPEDASVYENDVRTQINHAVWEFTQAGTLIRMFYDDFQNTRIGSGV